MNAKEHKKTVLGFTRLLKDIRVVGGMQSLLDTIVTTATVQK